MRIWNWIKTVYYSRQMKKVAKESVDHVLPTAKDVRHCNTPHFGYDSKVAQSDNPSELAAKIEKKRAELGRE